MSSRLCFQCFITVTILTLFTLPNFQAQTVRHRIHLHLYSPTIHHLIAFMANNVNRSDDNQIILLLLCSHKAKFTGRFAVKGTSWNNTGEQTPFRPRKGSRSLIFRETKPPGDLQVLFSTYKIQLRKPVESILLNHRGSESG